MGSKGGTGKADASAALQAAMCGTERLPRDRVGHARTDRCHGSMDQPAKLPRVQGIARDDHVSMICYTTTEWNFCLPLEVVRIAMTNVGRYALTREPTLWSKAYIAPIEFSIFATICVYSSAHCSSSTCSLTNHWSISVVAGSSASAATFRQA